MGTHESKPGAKPGRKQPPMTSVSRQEALPLSFAQQRMWFIEQLAPGGVAYNASFAARLQGPLGVAALERSLMELVRRHESLRTTFVLVEGKPVQRITTEPMFS